MNLYFKDKLTLFTTIYCMDMTRTILRWKIVHNPFLKTIKITDLTKPETRDESLNILGSKGWVNKTDMVRTDFFCWLARVLWDSEIKR